MKIAIASMFTALTSRVHSHNYGYIAILLEQCKNAGLDVTPLWSNGDHDWNDYDEIWLWQGLPMNDKVSMNLFGGSCEGNAAVLRTLANYRGKIRGIIKPVLPYNELAKRDWPEGMIVPGDWLAVGDHVRDQLPPIQNPNRTLALTLGDSHAPGVWEAYRHIDVRSGLTLHGALKLGLNNLIPKKYRVATIYFGQIDLRHHLCRLTDPIQEAYNLVLELERQCVALNMHSVELCELHPIEAGDRPIPTPGRYKGQPFFGTWQQREDVRVHFNEAIARVCKKRGFALYRYPKIWHLPDGKMNQAYMERPRSVHVAPEHYRAFR